MSVLLQLHLHSRLNICHHWTGQRQLEESTRNIYVWGIGAPYIRDFTALHRGKGHIVWVRSVGGQMCGQSCDCPEA